MNTASVWSTYNSFIRSQKLDDLEEDYYSASTSDVDSYSSFTSDMDDVTSCYSDITTGIDDDISSYTTASERTTTSGRFFSQSEKNITDDESSVSFTDLASLSLSDTESVNSSPVEKMCLHIHRDGRTEEFVRQLYQPLFDWVDPNGHIYDVINENNLPPGYGFHDKCGSFKNYDELNASCYPKKKSQNGNKGMNMPTVEIPSLAIVLFLREDALVGSERVDMASTIFERQPWKFHHSESVSRGKINAYPYNNQNYYTAGPNDPLCAIRQIHCGKQHVRLVRFTSIDTWQDQINLYSLFLRQEPDMSKSDFCMFTVSCQDEYDIQLALKKVPMEIKCNNSHGAALGFRVGQVGELVPLLPRMCTPISDTRWHTTDLHGNKIYLDVAKPYKDSDSGVSTSYPANTPSKTQKAKTKKHRNKGQGQNSFLMRSGNECDTSSVITDLDAFIKSILQPMMEHSRSETPLSMSNSTNSTNSGDTNTPNLSKSSSKSSVKSVRFNHVVNYLTDYTYPSETETEDEPLTDEEFQSDTEYAPMSFKAPPVVKNGYHLYYNDTDEESYYSEAGVDVENLPHYSVMQSSSKPTETLPHVASHSQPTQSLSGFYI